MRAWVALSFIVLPLAGCLSADAGVETFDTFDSYEVLGGDITSEFAQMVRNRSVLLTPAAGIDDVTVVAVIDGGLNPYHWDLAAEFMPQHLDADASNDLPLADDPAGWLPGHPGPEAFASYTRLDLNMSRSDPHASSVDLHGDDLAWGNVTTSTADEVHVNWIPYTKVVGFVTFSGDGFAAGRVHGMGSATVSTGNLHGACPQCLLVFVHGTTEEANEWVAKQDWIDAQTNSWGKSTAMRDRVYAGSDTELQRDAVQRGQQIFFSAGNGQANTFTAPNPTLYSSQEGPDWIVTVGAISPNDGSSYSGHGKPADIAAVGSSYPSGSYGGVEVTAEGNFGGTSNATPVTAGTYAEALARVRVALTGGSRTQEGGSIAVGDGACGAANPDCAVSDGIVTIDEMREALFMAAQRNAPGWNVAGVATLPTPSEPEMEFMAEGHGSNWGSLRGIDQYDTEIDAIVGWVFGDWHEAQPQDELDWFIVDSYCRQMLWGEWTGGYWINDLTPLPADDPDWPTRTNIKNECPTAYKAVVDAAKARDRPALTGAGGLR